MAQRHLPLLASTLCRYPWVGGEGGRTWSLHLLICKIPQSERFLKLLRNWMESRSILSNLSVFCERPPEDDFSPSVQAEADLVVTTVFLCIYTPTIYTGPLLAELFPKLVREAFTDACYGVTLYLTGGAKGHTGLPPFSHATCAWGHIALKLHHQAPCPYFLHLKQRSGDGTKASTFTRKYPMQISLGRPVFQNVKEKVFVSTSWSLILFLMDLTAMTTWSFISYVDVIHAG